MEALFCVLKMVAFFFFQQHLNATCFTSVVSVMCVCFCLLCLMFDLNLAVSYSIVVTVSLRLKMAAVRLFRKTEMRTFW